MTFRQKPLDIQPLELDEVSLEEGNIHPPASPNNDAALESNPPSYRQVVPHNYPAAVAIARKLHLIRSGFSNVTAMIIFGSMPLAVTKYADWTYNAVVVDTSIRKDHSKRTSFEHLICSDHSPWAKAMRTTYFLVGLTLLAYLVLLIHIYVTKHLPRWVYWNALRKMTVDERKAVYEKYEENLTGKVAQNHIKLCSWVFAWCLATIVAIITTVAKEKYCKGLTVIYNMLW